MLKQEETQMDTLIRHDQAPRFVVDGTTVTGYASPSRGSSSISAWRLVLAPGASSPLHSLTTDEALVALSGEATITLAEREVQISAGDGISIPPEVPFRIANAGDVPFEAVACMAAGGQARVGDATFAPPWSE
jgi:mannose-6-phosphate isomerase-like protein (cupin superfamily)